MYVDASALDVHGLTLSQAINVINKAIQTSYEKGVSVLYVNHGFNVGNKIKTWCLKNATENSLVIKVEAGKNEGISNIYIKMKMF